MIYLYDFRECGYIPFVLDIISNSSFFTASHSKYQIKMSLTGLAEEGEEYAYQENLTVVLIFIPDVIA